MYKCLHSHISIAGIAAETFANLKELTTLRLDNNLLIAPTIEGDLADCHEFGTRP